MFRVFVVLLSINKASMITKTSFVVSMEPQKLLCYLYFVVMR